MEYTVESPLGNLFVIDPNVDAARAIGSQVGITLAPRGVIPLPLA